MSQTSPLDRRLPVPGWYGLSFAVIVIVAVLLRFIRLDGYLLNHREAHWAYDSWSLYYGRPLPGSEVLPDESPLMLLWNTVGFFIIGVTDVTARVGSAILGVGMVLSILWLRPLLSKAQVLSIALLLAVSPTVVFASRTIEPGILAAFLSLVVVIAILRIGHDRDHLERWAMLMGFGAAGLYATGPIGVSALLAVVIGTVVGAISNGNNLVRRAMMTLGGDRTLLSTAIIALATTLLVLFTRFFSSISSISGITSGLGEWASMMSQGTTTLSVSFYFWSLMLYETIAVLIAVVGVIWMLIKRRESTPFVNIPVSLMLGWFLGTFVIFSPAASRDTGSAVLVALPVLVIAGLVLGFLLDQSDKTRRGTAIIGYVVGALLVAYSMNAAIGLAFTRGESGTEPLARDIPAPEANAFIDQTMRLSHDMSVTRASSVDPTGYYGLAIAVTPDYEWPFTWYFRDFHAFTVTLPGGFNDQMDIAIAGDNAGMDSAGLTPTTHVWLNKPSDALTRMRSGAIIRTGLNPANWGDAWNYMIHREVATVGDTRDITVGYSPRVVNQLTTNAGPFDLFENASLDAGGGLGQLNAPMGIAVGSDGTIYVLNAGNARIDRYAADGTFLGVWTGQLESALQLSWNGYQGGTGLTVGPDGLIYIADTWNHAVIVVSSNGKVARILGNRGVTTDITDQGSVTDQPGLFFGPRGIAVSENFIYVTDTGNERVQVFTKDGTFVKSFGGYGSDDGQFIEPTGIAIAPDGSIWVADSGNGRLQVFTPEGDWLASHIVPEWAGLVGTDRLNMLAFNDDGVLFYTVPNMGVFAWSDGESVQISQRAVQRPGGITFDTDGYLLITDTASSSVVKLMPVLPDGFGVLSATPQASPVATPAG
ncbi:MAG: TIGR03663 family protein [Thermomicrobiales bacterium]|nr:TIGR03663 family protein [Thermomicrobiales bacterium]